MEAHIIERVSPIGSNVVIKTEKNISSEYIELPDELWQNRIPNKGIVISIGPDVKEVSVGDMVAFGSYVGEDIWDKSKNTLYRILEEKSILAVTS